MHPAPGNAEDRLRHEGRVQVVATGHGFDDEFEGLDIVGRTEGVCILPVDFVLARPYFVVAGFNFKAKSF